MALSFYDIDKDYVKYLQKEETNERGFTRVRYVLIICFQFRIHV